MNRLVLALMGILALATPAHASETYPARHDVTGVAGDDVLNVRAGPDASAPGLGTLDHDARDIEVVRVRDGWGLVNIGERAGWVSMRYLARQPDGPLRPFTCSGTEPFWSMTALRGGGATLTTPDGPAHEFTTGPLDRAAGRSDRFSLRGTGRDGASFILVIRRAQCRDGMSDRAFGLDADLLLEGIGAAPHRSGCCSIAPR